MSGMVARRTLSVFKVTVAVFWSVFKGARSPLINNTSGAVTHAFM